MRSQLPRGLEMLLGLRLVAAQNGGHLAVEASGHDVCVDIVGVEMQHRFHLAADVLERQQGTKKSLDVRPAAEIDRAPEVRLRVAGRPGDGPLRHDAPAIVGGEAGLFSGGAILSVEEPRARQCHQGTRAGGLVARDGRLQQVASAVDPGRVRSEILQESAAGDAARVASAAVIPPASQ